MSFDTIPALRDGSFRSESPVHEHVYGRRVSGSCSVEWWREWLSSHTYIRLDKPCVRLADQRCGQQSPLSSPSNWKLDLWKITEVLVTRLLTWSLIKFSASRQATATAHSARWTLLRDNTLRYWLNSEHEYDKKTANVCQWAFVDPCFSAFYVLCVCDVFVTSRAVTQALSRKLQVVKLRNVEKYKPSRSDIWKWLELLYHWAVLGVHDFHDKINILLKFFYSVKHIKSMECS